MTVLPGPAPAREHGALHTAVLTLEYDGSKNGSKPATITSVLNVTGFENNITAGYFTTIGGDKSRDFFIVYFGTIKSGILNHQTLYLKQLMEPVFNPENFDQPSSPI